MRKARPPAERFWARVEKTETCWNWTGSLDTHGYGQFWNGEKTALVHRFSWELNRGSIPCGKMVCHHCDNPRCVRPDHLYVGDDQSNMKDRTVRKRHWANQRPEEFSAHVHRIGGLAPLRYGEANPSAKLSSSQVKEIRESSLGLTALAAKYGVCYQHIWNIKTKKQRTVA